MAVGKNAKLKVAKKVAEAAKLKLDFGCGPHPREGFAGVDERDFGQKYIVNLVERGVRRYKGDGVPTGWAGMPIPFKPWPWADESVSEAHASHFIEHLTADERIHFVNELYRVLKPGAKCQVVVPHWASARAYGDLTHQWPPVSEFWFYYLSKEWREANAPHNDKYDCNFDVTWGYSMHPQLTGRNQEYQSNAISWWKEAAQDTVATFTKK
jgi:SAM-dependent methyltransferase